MPQAGSSLRRLAGRPALAALVVVFLLLVRYIAGDIGVTTTSPAHAKPPASASASGSAGLTVTPPRKGGLPVESEADIEGIEDPLILEAAGRHWLEAKNPDLARKCFAAAIAKHEVNLYGKLAGTTGGNALVHEHMGEHDEARKAWDGAIASDVLGAAYQLAHFSRHPERAALLDAAKAFVTSAVEEVKAGGKPTIYITAKGEKRALEPISQEEAEKQIAAGERLRYVYIDVLDLSNRRWPTRVGCLRCVAGKILAWDADFEDQLDFTGFILDEIHLGKKWAGEVNKSSFEPASRFNRVYLDGSVVFGKAEFDSMVVSGRVANFPLVAFLGETNFRNAKFQGTAEFRMTHFAKPTSFKGAQFDASAYFAYAHFGGLDLSRVNATSRPLQFASATFAGDLLVEDASFQHGINFENARFGENVAMRRSFFDGTINLSRAITEKGFVFDRNEAKDLSMYGAIVRGDASFTNVVFNGSTRFSLDELTRREHLEDATPLHKLYKLYQGDDDAEEDLTKAAQYGVRSVNDLVSRFHGNVSFANTKFDGFLSFERVKFGTPGGDHSASFYNTQFGGEAHFERAHFNGVADFRTIGGEEVSFNQARFSAHWLLDDANVPGRLSMTEADLEGDATISMAGADIASFGIGHRQLLRETDDAWDRRSHRLFYEQCVEALSRGDDPGPFIDDPRLIDASWSADGEQRLTDPSQVAARLKDLCIGRNIDEFTRLRDAFESRSMADESDWAYWHLKHFINHRRAQDGVLGASIAFVERMVFEKAFGWGVLLVNLLLTSLVVVLVFAVLIRAFCGDMDLVWDGEPTRLSDLSPFALLMISLHGFLGGFGVADEFVKNSPSSFKSIYTTEIAVGIIVTTFFIGAYTRLVVSG